MKRTNKPLAALMALIMALCLASCGTPAPSDSGGGTQGSTGTTGTVGTSGNEGGATTPDDDSVNSPVVGESEAITLAPVELSVGTLIGYQMDGVYNFKGVPYATADRFQAPQPITEYPATYWSPAGTRMALAYGEVSPQSRTLNGAGEVNVVEFITPSNGVSDMVANETCQFLNIWTNDLNSDAKKPVIVFFHGGGLESGASNELSIYTGEYFAAIEDAVLVTVTHRLNYLGFLDLSAYGEQYESSGMAGMLDCVAALEWVRDNISQFGGDPSNVTIAGQSGGGGKVAALSCMPAADGLFDKVVYMSGVNMFIDQEGENGSLAQTQKLADYLGLSGQNFVDRVTSMSYEELYAACNAAGVSYNCTVGCSALPDPLFDDEGKLNELAAKRTWMIGCTVGEGATNGTSFILSGSDDYHLPSITDENAMARLTERYGDNAQAVADAFRAAYPGHSLAESLFVAISGSMLSRSHDVDAQSGLITQFNAAGKEVYNYVVAYTPPLLGGMLMWHTGDIGWWFYSLDEVPYMVRGDENNAYCVARQMADTLASFAADGDPSTATLQWTPYTSNSHDTMVFDVNSQCRTGYDEDLIRLITQ